VSCRAFEGPNGHPNIGLNTLDISRCNLKIEPLIKKNVILIIKSG